MDRSLRLREDWEVRNARARGKAFAQGPIVVRVFPHPDNPIPNRYAVVAGKKVGKAHERNRCKRLVREVLRNLHPTLKQGNDIVVILRGGPDELTGYDLALDTLRTLFQRARLLEGQESSVKRQEETLPLTLDP
jgi:ribonuclease P protein component